MAHLKKRKKHYTLEGYGDFPGIKGYAPGISNKHQTGLGAAHQPRHNQKVWLIESSPLKKKHFLQ
jgi:hypothetical protein